MDSQIEAMFLVLAGCMEPIVMLVDIRTKSKSNPFVITSLSVFLENSSGRLEINYQVSVMHQSFYEQFHHGKRTYFQN